MTRGSGGRIENLVVVPHRPWYLLLTRIVSAVLTVALVVGAFVYGSTEGFQSRQGTAEQLQAVRADLRAAEQELETLRQRATVLERGAQVDRDAAERVRQTNRELRDEIAALQQEVRLYRGIMAPDDGSVGLAVDEFAVRPIGENRFRFTLLMTHVASDGTWLEGSVGVNIVGQNETGDRVVYALQDVSPDIDSVDIRIRYRYFQEIEGEIAFPQGFVPETVRVVAQVTGNRASTRDVEFGWDDLGEL